MNLVLPSRISSISFGLRQLNCISLCLLLFAFGSGTSQFKRLFHFQHRSLRVFIGVHRIPMFCSLLKKFTSEIEDLKNDNILCASLGDWWECKKAVIIKRKKKKRLLGIDEDLKQQ